MDTLNRIVEKFGIETWRSDRMPIVVDSLTRDGFAALVAELGFHLGAEIGVERGRYSKSLLKANPRLTLYGVDPWETYNGYRDYVSQQQLDEFYADTQRRLAPYPGAKLIRAFSAEAVKDFHDESLDFVYIDGNHDLMNVVTDLTLWSKKVRPGGIVAGHDYVRRTSSRTRTLHVIEGVVAFTKCYDVSPWFVFGNRREAGSFMWVKT